MSKETAPKLNSFSLKISEIQAEAFTWKIPKTNRTGGLLVLSGFYGRGSAGKKDAIYIRNLIDMFAESSRLNALIVDLKELDYVWGDDLRIWPSGWNLHSYPLRIVIPSETENAEVHKALTWAIDEELIVTDVLQAFKDIRETLR